MATSDSDIIGLAQAGQEEAFRMLVQQHSRRVFGLAYRLTGDAADAEEVVQETFLKVFRRIGSFESRARFETWLYRVAANTSMDLLRRQLRHRAGRTEIDADAGPVVALPDEGPDPERRARGGQLGRSIEAAMQRLTVAERAAFTLRHVEGFSIREIGEALGLRGNAVKNAIFRAVQKMRQELEPLRSEAK